MEPIEGSEKLSNIREYIQHARATQDERVDIEDSQSTLDETRFGQVLKSLQDRVTEQRRALEELRKSSSRPAPRVPSGDPRVRLQQLRAIRAGYDHVTHSQPTLPPAGSPIPALLATQVTAQRITGIREAILESQSRLAHVRGRFEGENRNLEDNNLITEKLDERIARLRQQRDEQLQKSTTDVANEQVHAMQVRKEYFEQEIKRYQQALHDFIDDHLAAMVAAEELGGPTVGDMLNVNEEMLENGFSAQGKPKSSSKAPSKTTSGQMLLDKHGNLIRGSQEDENPSEKEAAAAIVKALLNELLEALLGHGASGGYITLQGDTAAARFLVRAKVAQLHPKDARRLRLIDFGRAFDD
ncbi:hypothetical protein EV356DRAFT_484734 [Viridothelium virens]|uniref:Uncharacterized protein n=1 Tax=Viridothelium virens TaxID=1048519 RepID=A0A6A6HB86_VIRVR|nr:hypothetical protein EV356DRAFT_484734 [Viridothelium virens]